MTALITTRRLSPVEIESEPRILDLDLAERLGFERPRKIRELIYRNKAELEGFGLLPFRDANLISPHGGAKSRGRGRPTMECWLNEPQALLLCMFSNTDKAAAVRKQVIEVFMDWRAGKIVHAKEHLRRAPARRPVVHEFRIVQRIADGPIEVHATMPLAIAMEMLVMFQTRVRVIG